MYYNDPENKFALYSQFISLTGIRPEELHKLRWTDVSRDFSSITAHSTDGTHRTITLSDEAMSALREIRNRFSNGNSVLPPHAISSYDDTSELRSY